MKRTWTEASAKEWVSNVKAGKNAYGLKFCSACDFLKVSAAVMRNSR